MSIIVNQQGKVLTSDGSAIVAPPISAADITKELLASLDSDFKAENIKKNVDLFGLIGTLEGGGGGANAVCGTFTPSDNTKKLTVTHGLGVQPTFAAVMCTSEPTVTIKYVVFMAMGRSSDDFQLPIISEGSRFIVQTSKTKSITAASGSITAYYCAITNCNETQITFGDSYSRASVIYEGNKTYYWVVAAV